MSWEWRETAKCRTGVPSLLFFPEGRGKERNHAVREALAVCAACPVRVQCARDALRVGAAHGVYAGVDLGNGGNYHISPQHQQRLLAVVEGA